MIKLNAAQLRKGPPSHKASEGKKNEIYIVLDNVLDTYNVGSIFRLADAVGVKKIYLCGQTATPPNPRIKKASINTTEWVDWEYCETALEAIRKIQSTSEVKKMQLHLQSIHFQGEKHAITPWKCKDRGVHLQIVAIEQSTKSVQYDQFEYKLPICLVVGNETYGVSKEVLEIVDGLPAGEAGIVEIPMFGVNISLNVMVSLGIILYKVLEDLVVDSKDF